MGLLSDIRANSRARRKVHEDRDDKRTLDLQAGNRANIRSEAEAFDRTQTEQQKRSLIPGAEMALNQAGVTDQGARFGAGYQLGSAQTSTELAGASGLVSGMTGSEKFSAQAAAAKEAALAKQRTEQLGAELDNRSKQQGIEEKTFALRLQEQTGGRPVAAWTKDVRAIDTFGFMLGTVSDLQVMNRELGRETLPSEAKGLYETNRTYLTNEMGSLFLAGALSSQEIDFYSGYIPEFGVFSTWSAPQRNAKLRRLSEIITAKTQSLVGTTKGTTMPDTPERTLEQIMGEPAKPEGAERMDSTLFADIKAQAAKDLEASGVAPAFRKATEGLTLDVFSPTGTK